MLKPTKMLLTGLAALIVTACNQGPTLAGPRLTFLNVNNGQTLSGIVQRSPGVTVTSATPTQVNLQVLRSDGSVLWERNDQRVPACITGDTNGVCNTFQTNQQSNGDYAVLAKVTLSDGQVISDRVGFRISNGGTTPPPPPPTPPGTKPSWNAVNSWGIQYHGFTSASLTDIANTNLDVIVLGRFDHVGREWKAPQINQLTTKKWVFSYIAVGQAQTIEWYWQSNWSIGNPSWLLSTSEYNGTYNVAYWDAAWQQVVFDSIDRIITDGFDGVFLDQSDPYWNNSFPKGSTPTSTFMSRSRDLVCNIYNHAHAKKADFKIFVNGGANQFDTFGSSYANCLDATAGEHLWYLGSGRPDSSGYPAYTIPVLQRLAQSGKKVFTFDYTSNASEVSTVLSTARSKGFIPTVTDGSISTTPKAY
jgi:cysteinyl-tRNA synthetase, unknown class